MLAGKACSPHSYDRLSIAHIAFGVLYACLSVCNCRSKKGQSATLDDWLGSSGPGGAATGPRDMLPLLLPRVPLPPLMLPSGDAGAVRPAKKRKGLTAADRDVEAVMLRMLKQVWVRCRSTCISRLSQHAVELALAIGRFQYTGQCSSDPSVRHLPSDL